MSGLLRGALAGAAGTTALNATTYLDMAVRGRATSDSPEQVVEKTAAAAGIAIPGSGGERDNRVAGLAPLSGSAVGVVIGSVFGSVHRAFARRGRSIPAPVEIALIAAAAMVLSDVPLRLLGISDPAGWTAKDWVSDVVPHLVYGTVTYATLVATEQATV